MYVGMFNRQDIIDILDIQLSNHFAEQLVMDLEHWFWILHSLQVGLGSLVFILLAA